MAIKINDKDTNILKLNPKKYVFNDTSTINKITCHIKVAFHISYDSLKNHHALKLA
jgi:hypothetical protein